MNIDPIVVSLIAIGISILSLVISIYRGVIERRLQWEQLRGAIHTRLTAHGVDVIALIQNLLLIPTDEKTEVVKKLVRIAEALVNMRKSLQGMEVKSFLWTSILLTKFTYIKSRLDDADIIFEKIKTAIRDLNIAEANIAADGLIKRLYGAQNRAV